MWPYNRKWLYFHHRVSGVSESVVIKTAAGIKHVTTSTPYETINPSQFPFIYFPDWSEQSHHVTWEYIYSLERRKTSSKENKEILHFVGHLVSISVLLHQGAPHTQKSQWTELLPWICWYASMKKRKSLRQQLQFWFLPFIYIYKWTASVIQSQVNPIGTVWGSFVWFVAASLIFHICELNRVLDYDLQENTISVFNLSHLFKCYLPIPCNYMWIY